MMNRTRKVNLLAAAIVALTVGTTALADGPAKQLPLSDFLDTQGSTTIFNPPVPDYFGWTAPPPGVKTPAPSYVGGNGAACDYAGLAKSLGWWTKGPINDPKDLGPALKEAVAVVKSGQPALIDSVTQPR
jgi:hypothetical protein